MSCRRARVGTGEDAWSRFLEFASWARAKPSFDIEEREPRLELAGTVRTVLEAARDGQGWLAALERSRLLRGHVAGTIATPIPHGFIAPALRRQFQSWAAGDEATMGRALAAFLESDRDPVERFASFAEAAGAVQAATGAPGRSETVLAFGSLFNFAVAPDALPLVRPGLSRPLARILGQRLDEGSPVAEYEGHLAFAREHHERMEKAGIPVRDMVDVESLMLLAAQFRDLWAPGSESAAQAGSPSKRRGPSGARKRSTPYLAVCAIYRDEALYLREWIEFHRLAGVERFFLYDNESTDDHRAVLAPYLESGIVALHEWPGTGQFPAYEDCLDVHRDDARWIAFLDLDEFLFAPGGKPLPEVLSAYEEFPGVGVNWAIFGTSGHVSRPAGPVIESYLQRLNTPDNRTVKSVVDPTRALRPLNAHQFSYTSGFAVDENKYPIHSYFTKSVSFSRLRVNHYYTKSLSEYLARRAPRADQLVQRRVEPEKMLDAARSTEERDETILSYLPALREALSSRR